MADQQIVQIVPSTRANVFGLIRLNKRSVEIGGDVFPRGIYPSLAPGQVSRCSPKLPTDLATPLPDVVSPVLAQAEQDVAVLRRQNGAHQPIRLLHLRLRVILRRVLAPVVLEEVKSPGRELVRVLLLVPKTSLVFAAGERRRRRIQSCLHAHAVHIRGHGLHVGKALTGPDISLGVARLHAFLCSGRFDRPAVVNIDVGVAMIDQAG